MQRERGSWGTDRFRHREHGLEATGRKFKTKAFDWRDVSPCPRQFRDLACSGQCRAVALQANRFFRTFGAGLLSIICRI
jgi:hypothetical protein